MGAIEDGVKDQVTPPEGSGSGIENSIEQLREQNRIAQEQIARLSQNNDLLTQLVMQQKPEGEKEVVDDYFDPEEVKRLEGIVSRKLDPVVNALARQTIETQEAIFRKDHPDYDEVIAYTKKMMAADPTLAKMIQSDANPPRAAYLFGFTNPENQKTTEDRLRQKIASETLGSPRTPQTLGGISGGISVPSGNTEVDRVNSESRADFQKRLNAIRNP